MSFWNNFKKATEEWVNTGKAEWAKFRDRPTATALMATCALIAAADGSVSPAEKAKMAGFILSNDVLKQYSAADLKEDFDKFVAALMKDFDFGKIDCVQAIIPFKDKPQATMIVQLGVIIGGSDGNFDDKEKAVVKELCGHLGLDPATYNL